MNKQRLGLFLVNQAIRDFFKQEDFLEVQVPPMVKNPGMEAHLHPFQIKSINAGIDTDWFLHTSPEFHMKELLSEGFENIFNLSYCFRDEPDSQTHRPQFLMLEWYRANTRYEKIMDDSEALLQYCLNYLREKNVECISDIEIERLTVEQAFKKYVGFSILEGDLLENIQYAYPQYYSEDLKKLPWEDLFYLIFLNEIEPRLNNTLLYEYPAELAALSTLKESDPRVCERFEIYLNGVEICNCFNELTDLAIQKERMKEESKKKLSLYGYKLNKPEVLYSALEKGLPPSAGIALGVERLYSALTGIENPFYN